LENNSNRYFFRLSFLIIAVLIFLTAFVFLTARFFSLQTYRIILYAIAFILFFAVMLFLTGFIWIKKIITRNEKNNNRKTVKNPFAAKLSFRLFMPFLLAVSDLINYNKDEIRRIYINICNEYIKTGKIKVSPEKMLVILPHCFQLKLDFFRNKRITVYLTVRMRHCHSNNLTAVLKYKNIFNFFIF
jgi:hypothetical protein